MGNTPPPIFPGRNGGGEDEETTGTTGTGDQTKSGISAVLD